MNGHQHVGSLPSVRQDIHRYQRVDEPLPPSECVCSFVRASLWVWALVLSMALKVEFKTRAFKYTQNACIQFFLHYDDAIQLKREIHIQSERKFRNDRNLTIAVFQIPLENHRLNL